MINKFRYLIFLTLTTNSLFPYLFLLFLMCLVISFGMLSYYSGLFSAEALRAEGIDNLLGGGFIDSFWWSLKHVLDPGALSENYGSSIISLSGKPKMANPYLDFCLLSMALACCVAELINMLLPKTYLVRLSVRAPTERK